MLSRWRERERERESERESVRGTESERAASAMQELGVELMNRIIYFNNEREILVFKKSQSTKKVYPRSYSLIKKSPL